MTTYDRRYTEKGSVAHLVDPLGLWSSINNTALCGLPAPWDGWLGSGTQDEYEKAEAMPTCRRCTKITKGKA